MKPCNKCKTKKEHSEFATFTRKDGTRGERNICTVCYLARARSYAKPVRSVYNDGFSRVKQDFYLGFI